MRSGWTEERKKSTCSEKVFLAANFGGDRKPPDRNSEVEFRAAVENRRVEFLERQ